MTRPYVIVWDLDGTIGVFKALNHSIGADTPVSVEIRPGMAETLQKLSRAGFSLLIKQEKLSRHTVA